MTGLILILTGMSVGCSSIPVPKLALPNVPTLKMSPALGAVNSDIGGDYLPIGAGAGLSSSTFTESVYRSVKEAQQSNSIVLQVLQDDSPLRVLPLPNSENVSSMGSDGVPSVYVSTLLKQTGILDRLGRVQAALYRQSPDNVEGIRMDVVFTNRGKGSVRPESDYALRPGDRIVIGRAAGGGLGSVVDVALGR